MKSFSMGDVKMFKRDSRASGSGSQRRGAPPRQRRQAHRLLLQPINNKLLLYEYMPRGSLENHRFRRGTTTSRRCHDVRIHGLRITIITERPSTCSWSTIRFLDRFHDTSLPPSSSW